MLTELKSVPRTIGAAALSLALLAPATSWAQGGPDGPPPANVITDVVTLEMMAPQLEVPGTIISRNDSRISSEVTGRIDWMAEIGAELEQGEPIAQLDKRMLELRLQENEASVASLESSLRYQRADVRRLRELASRNNASTARVEEGVSRMEVAEQQLVQARVTRDRTLYDIERASIPAPFSGRVVERLMQPGEYANAGSVVARLVDTHNLEVVAQAPINVATYALEAETLVVRTPNEGPITGDVRTIVPVGDQITRTFELRVTLPPNGWIVGTPVRVAVPSAQPRQVIAVPRDAIILRSDGNYVFRITAENTAERIQVQVGVAQGERIEVVGNLEEGDQIVIRGAESLREGQSVAIGEAS